MKLLKNKIAIFAAIVGLSFLGLHAAIIPIGPGPKGAVTPILGPAQIVTTVNALQIEQAGTANGSIVDKSAANDATLSLTVTGSISLSSSVVSSLNLTAAANGLTEIANPGSSNKSFEKNGITVSVSLDAGAASQYIGNFAFDGLANKGSLSLTINGVPTVIVVSGLILKPY